MANTWFLLHGLAAFFIAEGWARSHKQFRFCGPVNLQHCLEGVQPMGTQYVHRHCISLDVISADTGVFQNYLHAYIHNHWSNDMNETTYPRMLTEILSTDQRLNTSLWARELSCELLVPSIDNQLLANITARSIICYVLCKQALLNTKITDHAGQKPTNNKFF